MRTIPTSRRFITMLLFTLLSAHFFIASSQTFVKQYNWDSTYLWNIEKSDSSKIDTFITDLTTSSNGSCLKMKYSLKTKQDEASAWVRISKPIEWKDTAKSISFYVKVQLDDIHDTNYLEFNLFSANKVFNKTIPLLGGFGAFTPFFVCLKDLHFSYDLNAPSSFKIAIKGGNSSGTIWFDEVGFDSSAFVNITSPILNNENPGILEWLKKQQDNAKNGGIFLADDDQDHPVQSLQLYDNSKSAMIFAIRGSSNPDLKTRAEKILDFFNAASADSNITDSTLQSFFYKKKARGFYQYFEYHNVTSNYYRREDPKSNRWIGDNAWLLLACKHYEAAYHDTLRYHRLTTLIASLIIDLYVDDPSSGGGYISCGWEGNDSSFNKQPHFEGNIDCYAALQSVGDTIHAKQIKKWLDANSSNRNYLDEYVWRVLAYNKNEYSTLLDTVQYDPMFRKLMQINSNIVMGFYTSRVDNANNYNTWCNTIWVEGIADLACACYAMNRNGAANFFLNQMDPFIIDGSYPSTKTLPYFSSENTGKLSPCTWYLLAHSKVNPFIPAKTVPVKYGMANPTVQNAPIISISQFQDITTIRYKITTPKKVILRIYTLSGQLIKELVNTNQSTGQYAVQWDGRNALGAFMASDIYFYRLTIGGLTITNRIMLKK